MKQTFPVLAIASLTAVSLLTLQPRLSLAQSLAELPPPPASKLPAPGVFADQQLQALDKNRDRRVSWDEFSSQLRKAFVDMDTTRRGYLTRDDLMHAYRKALEANGQPVPKE